MKDKIKSLSIAIALVLCVGITACENSNTENAPYNLGKMSPASKAVGSIFSFSWGSIRN